MTTQRLRLGQALDDDTCEQVRQDLAGSLHRGLRDLVLDLRDCTTIDAAGLQLLHGLDAHLTRMGGAVLVVNADPHLERRLSINDLGHLLLIRSSPTAVPLPVREPEHISGVISLDGRRKPHRRLTGS